MILSHNFTKTLLFVQNSSLVEKRCNFYMNLFVIISVVTKSVYRENKFHKILNKDSIPKINTAKLAFL